MTGWIVAKTSSWGFRRMLSRFRHAIASASLLAELAQLVADGGLEIPIANTYPLDRVREAFVELADRHTHGKIVLLASS